MKHLKHAFWTILLTVIGVLCVFGAACSDAGTVEFKFETNGGAAIESVEVAAGETYTLPTPSEREGYEFDGWYLASDFSGESVTSVVAENDATFYAKWEQLYLVTFELGGGSLDAPKLYLKEGATVLDAVKSYTPTKTGCEFGEWLVNGAPLTASTKMTTSGVTLTAHYKVGYTVEVYLQKLTLDGYEKGENVTGFAYAGDSFTPSVTLNGYTEIDHADAVKTKVLSDDPSANVFKFYFDRQECSVIFYANYPTGGNESEARYAIYGSELDMPDLFAYEGCYLVGWARSEDGKAEFKTNEIYRLLRNGEGKDADVITVDGDMTLFAVWSKGYRDMFGGIDVIYLLEDDAEEIFLCREGLYFVGEYRAARNEFTFYDESDDILMEGVLFDDGTFAYFDETRDGFSATRYNYVKGLVNDEQIYLNGYNEIIYSVALSGGSTRQSEGTYTINEQNEYVASFTTGEYAGRTLTFRRMILQSGSTTRNIFLLKNDEEFALGVLNRYAIREGDLVYFTSSYMLSLDGYGIATISIEGEESQYYYGSENGIYTLNNRSSGAAELAFKIIDLPGGRKGWASYTDSLDHTFTLCDDVQSANYVTKSGTLATDGCINATYKGEDGNEISGYFTSRASIFGGDIITIYTEEQSYTFLTRTVTIVTDDEEAGEQTNYLFCTRLENYAEYYYKDEDGLYYCPAIVFGEEEGKVSVYGRTEQGTYARVAVGTVEEAEGKYIYTREKIVDDDTVILPDPIDARKIESCIFGVGVYSGSSSSYNVSFFFSAKIDDSEEVYADCYTNEEDGDEFTLYLVGGLAVLYSDVTYSVGTYATQESGETVLLFNGLRMVVDLDEDNGTFTFRTGIYGTATGVNEDGTANEEEEIKLDGKGGATLTVGPEEEAVTTEGKVVELEETTAFGSTIYQFEANEGDMQFKFVVFTVSSTSYFSRYNENYHGTYTSENGELILDGYGYTASYSVDEGDPILGMYFVPEENVVCLAVSGGYIYFDLKAGNTFTVRRSEAGAYIILDNWSMRDDLLRLDGYGNFTLYSVSEEGEETEKASGTYELDENGSCVLTFTEGVHEGVLEGTLGILTSGTQRIRAFIVAYSEVISVFVNDADWTVIVTDSIGNAVRYNKLGAPERGQYVIITENLFYFANEEGTDACIYRYDTEKNTVTPISFVPKGYYTENLESMLFSQYGFMTFNGETRYYYNVDADGSVTIYHQDPENAQANDYGFVAQDFGKFDIVKQFEGKTYYINDGYALNFDRKTESKGDYPLPFARDEEGNISERYPLERLTFTPGGSLEFSSTGIVVINGQNYSCTVTRHVLESGETETYITVGGYFRCYIDLSYHVSESGEAQHTYSVTNMQYVQTLPAYQFIYTYYLYYMFLGQAAANRLQNTVGVISIMADYDKEGNESERYVNGVFGSDSGMVDFNGDLISLDKAEYEIDQESGFYTVKYEGKDGHHYLVIFDIQNLQSVGLGYCYRLIAFARVETLTAEGGYTVEIQRAIVSDVVSAGSIYTAILTKNGTEIDAATILIRDGNLYFIERTITDGHITATKYYAVLLTLNTSEDIGEESNILPTYKSATVKEIGATVYYTADRTGYVDLLEDEEDPILMFVYGGTRYLVSTCEYDAATQTYTVTTTGNVKFTIKIDGENAVITQI